jgi:DNA polymerase-3 subunit epsilon
LFYVYSLKSRHSGESRNLERVTEDIGETSVLREIVLDTEATGFLTAEGHRLVSVTAVEMIDRKLTGREFEVIINPERDIPAETVKIHGITNQAVADKPVFAAIAKSLKEFVGDAPIIITCRTVDGVTLDIDFLDMEMKKAGLAPFKAEQWVNVRRWSEAMFGHDNARLDQVLDHYKIDRSARDKNGHSATLDARLLAAVYPLLLADYEKFKSALKTKPPVP